MLPWWGLFGVLSHTGADARIVHCFRRFCGIEWSMANGLAQGCPASPDLMNILFEPFPRWAAAQGKGVRVEDTTIASVSFVDDVM